jgi:hypothetical protein
VDDLEKELGDLLTRHTEPSRTEVVRAKRLQLEALDGGELRQSGELLELLATADGVPPLPSDPRFQLPDRESASTVLTADHPVVRRFRAEAASREALGELTAAGLIVPVGPSAAAQDTDPRVGYEVPGLNSSFTYRSPRPHPIAEVVRLPHRLVSQPVGRLDPDLFCADLEVLKLDTRTIRCIREALDSYRRELYLACASLLGAASEGAWYASGEKLRHLDPKIDLLLDSDSTAALQAAVTGVLRVRLPKELRWESDYLSTHAELLRALRNYGVHPRASQSADLEHMLNEEACGLLILNTHRYLVRLADAVVAAS